MHKRDVIHEPVATRTPAHGATQALAEAASSWAAMAVIGFFASAFLLGITAWWPQWWQRQALRDTLQWGFLGPSLMALANFGWAPHFVKRPSAAARWAAAQVVLITFWLCLGGGVACAHLWAHQNWLVPSLPAPWSVGLGVGALSPLAVAALMPHVIRGRSRV